MNINTSIYSEFVKDQAGYGAEKQWFDVKSINKEAAIQAKDAEAMQTNQDKGD